jgi:ribosomal-protein-alanine N-acetyltransferase
VSIGVRLIDRADAPTLAALHAACFTSAWHADAFAALLAQPGSFALLAQPASDTPAMGFALLRVAADEAEILTIGVVPAARRQGLARALVQAGAHQATDLGAKHLFLEADAANTPAIGLYRSLGFEQAGHRRGYYREQSGTLSDALVLRAALPLVLK